MLSPQSHVPFALDLVPISLAAVRSELAQDGKLGDLLQAEVTPEWPPSEWEPHVLHLLEEAFLRDPIQQDFHRYILLHDPACGRPVLIGNVGAFAWPDRPGEFEIGYGILPRFQRRGHATEATRRHVQWLLTQPGRADIVAQTYPHLEASLRLLTGLGFVRDGPGRNGDTIGLRLRQP